MAGQVRALVIVDDEDYQKAGDFLRDNQTLIKAIKDHNAPIKEAAHAAHKAAVAGETAMLREPLALEGILKDKMGDFYRRRQEEQRRAEEARRVAMERARKEAEDKRLAEAQAQEAAAAKLRAEAKAAEEAKAQAVAEAKRLEDEARAFAALGDIESGMQSLEKAQAKKEESEA